MCIYDIIDELMNINEIKCKTSNQIFPETFHDNSMRFSAITLFNYAQYYSIKSRPLSMTFKLRSFQNGAPVMALCTSIKKTISPSSDLLSNGSLFGVSCKEDQSTSTQREYYI